MTLYDTLGVAKDATAAEIKTAYRRAASAAHPDREGGSTERMAAVNKAWEILGDEKRRARYDETGDEQEGPSIKDHARQAVMQVFDKCVMQSDSLDIVAEAREAFRNAIKGHKEDRKDAERSMAKMEKRRGKVSVSKGENLFDQILNSKIARVKNELEILAKSIEVGEAALDMLKVYSYKMPEPAPVPEFTASQHNDFVEDFFRSRGISKW